MLFIEPDTPLPAGTLVLANTEDVRAHADALRTVRVVALEFPRWTDGRAYSQAVVLRGRLRYAGEIRATGEVVADMLPLLRRCGFDAVQLAPGQRRETAERTLVHVDAHYQGDARQALAHRALAPEQAA